MTQQRDDADNLRFAENVDGGGSVTLTTEMDTAATIEEVRVRIYNGPEWDLHISPFVQIGGDDAPRTDLINYQGKDYVDGNADHFKFPVSESVTPGDVVGVDVENVEEDWAYDFSVDMDIEYLHGSERVESTVSRFLGKLSGVL